MGSRRNTQRQTRRRRCIESGPGSPRPYLSFQVHGKSFCSKSSCTYVHSLQRAKDTDAAPTVACIRKSNQGHEFLTIPVRSMAVFGGAGGKVGMLLAVLGSCGGLLGSFLRCLPLHQVQSPSSGHLQAMWFPLALVCVKQSAYLQSPHCQVKLHRP